MLVLEQENAGLSSRVQFVSRLLARRRGALGAADGALEDNKDSDRPAHASDTENPAHPSSDSPSGAWPLGADGVDARWSEELALARAQGWLVRREDVTLGAVLGRGTFGTTRRAMWRGAEVAVKSVAVGDPGLRGTLLRELEALRRVRHPHIMGFYGACVVGEADAAEASGGGADATSTDPGAGDPASPPPPLEVWLLCELLPGGTLAEWTHGAPGSGRAPRRAFLERLRAVLDVARGMQALEDATPPILHRDLKPSNVFFDAHGTAKVADMGLARVLAPGTQAAELTGETGTYSYMSPEMVRHEPYDTRSDVWSFGVLALEVLTQRRPYAGSHLTPVQIAIGVSEGALFPQLPADLPEPLADLLLVCFSPDPAERPPFGLLVTQLAAILESEERAAKSTPARDWLASRPWAARVLGGASQS